ncbi:MAG: hypothetical protein JWO81_2520 [Alphaproteobacteria bacterium]|nr:hypothetical protein [Alphaproteobacteria bacterium]
MAENVANVLFCLFFGVPLALGLKIAWRVNYGIGGRAINWACVFVYVSAEVLMLAIVLGAALATAVLTILYGTAAMLFLYGFGRAVLLRFQKMKRDRASGFLRQEEP